ncbi:hypothetical protein P3S68_020310 [Capsicum galapagoense]
MGYPSMSKHNNIIPMPSYNNDPYEVSSSQKYKALQDQIIVANVKSVSLCCHVMIGMLILMIGMIVVSVFMWMMYEREKPQFQIVSLQVPTGIEITDTSMLGNWQINGTMRNMNDDVEMDFMPGGRIGIFYETSLLTENFVESFRLEGKSSTFLFYNMTTSPMTVVEKGILSNANRDRNTDGVMKFSLQINLKYAYVTSRNMKIEKMRIYCNNMKVQFGHRPKDRGESIGADKINCIGDIL